MWLGNKIYNELQRVQPNICYESSPNNVVNLCKKSSISNSMFLEYCWCMSGAVLMNFCWSSCSRIRSTLSGVAVLIPVKHSLCRHGFRLPTFQWEGGKPCTELSDNSVYSWGSTSVCNLNAGSNSTTELLIVCRYRQYLFQS